MKRLTSFTLSLPNRKCLRSNNQNNQVIHSVCISMHFFYFRGFSHFSIDACRYIQNIIYTTTILMSLSLSLALNPLISLSLLIFQSLSLPDTHSKAARTQTEAPRMRGQVQPSAGQPNTTQPSTQALQPATGALGRVGAGGPDGLIAVPYTSKDSLLVSKWLHELKVETRL